ncbi:nucleotidyl transferase AbiEii/AbiGii toxin family protein [Candidatus Woesearchaeota archaeon]|nr:nucleotidyl transferase AbiEii/AbiGii toxin family protein [Candidatus Woesearchaeota archaeon]
MGLAIPLALRMKKESHRKIAAAQDIVVKEVYGMFNNAVFHGGTAIWRCYVGKRFSEDLDFYLPREVTKINELFNRLAKKGFTLKKRKIAANSVYSEMTLERVNLRFEATFQKKKGHLLDYENIDGTFTSVYSLTPEEFIIEKVHAYLKRRKIRDLYDLFFLTPSVTNQESVAPYLQQLMKQYQEPLDKQDLKTTILEGIIPQAKDMLEYLKRKWRSKNT